MDRIFNTLPSPDSGIVPPAGSTARKVLDDPQFLRDIVEQVDAEEAARLDKWRKAWLKRNDWYKKNTPKRRRNIA